MTTVDRQVEVTTDDALYPVLWGMQALPLDLPASNYLSAARLLWLRLAIVSIRSLLGRAEQSLQEAGEEIEWLGAWFVG